ncbi:MAG: UMP kinase [bacterium]
MPKTSNSKTIVISLGGSIISPEAGKVGVIFLKKFRQLVLGLLKKGFKFIIICGGGKVCRLYQLSASKITNAKNEDKDWLGIHAIRLNAHLLRTAFREVAYPVVLDNPHKPIKNHWKLLVASAWKPGWSSDYNAVLFARRFGIKTIINAGNISFVFDKDPAKFKNARFFKQIAWKDYRKLISSRWIPGLSTPFDPIASRLAQKSKIRALIVKGTDLKNLEKAILNQNFKGTIIS